MRITKKFRDDRDFILHFLDVFGGGVAILSSSKRASSGFFIFAHTFMKEYVEDNFFKAEELLITALEDNGFSADEGPISALRSEQEKCRETSEHMLNASKGWLGGDEEARGEVGWAASDYASALRQHLDRLKNLIIPLLEQNISPEDEHRISEGLNKIAFENTLKKEAEDKYVRLIQSLEDELSDWR
jgi:hemerythrin-like domain-containing protein